VTTIRVWTMTSSDCGQYCSAEYVVVVAAVGLVVVERMKDAILWLVKQLL
jgi:hypothetical protein